jgi:hypothetical protein
LDSLAFER